MQTAGTSGIESLPSLQGGVGGRLLPSLQGRGRGRGFPLKGLGLPFPPQGLHHSTPGLSLLSHYFIMRLSDESLIILLTSYERNVNEP